MGELKGRPVQIGAASYVVPRVLVAQYFQMKEEAETFKGDLIEAFVAQILGLLARNYPGLTREKFLAETEIELCDLEDAHRAVMEAAKKKRDDAPGEAPSP